MAVQGVILAIICAIITAISVLGIIIANQGKVETFEIYQLGEIYKIADMPFPDVPAEGAADPTANHPKSDSLVQLILKKTDDSLTGRLRLIEGLVKKYEALEVAMVGEDMERFTSEYDAELEKRYIEDVTSYGIYRNLTSMTLWEKFCMFAVTFRSLMLIFGFLGMGLGVAIASSSNFESDLDDPK